MQTLSSPQRTQHYSIHAARSLRALLLTTAVALLFGAAPVLAQAQRFPSKPIRMLMPNPPGGPTDIVARAYVEKLSTNLGQPVILEYRPGANGALVANSTIAAPADGYTLAFSSIGGQAIGPAANEYKKTRSGPDVLRELAPVSLLGEQTLLLVVSPTLGVSTVKEFIELIRKNPGKYNFTSAAGVGGIDHLGGELFNKEFGLTAVHVPVNGVAPAISSLITGETHYWFGPPAPLLPQYKAGKIKILASGSSRRAALFPEVPTVAEAAGLPGFELAVWWGILVRTGTDKDIVNRLSREIQKVAEDPGIGERLAGFGIEAKGSSPEEFGRRITADVQKWLNLMEKTRVTLD